MNAFVSWIDAYVTSSRGSWPWAAGNDLVSGPPGDGLEPLCRDQSAEHYEWPCVPRPPKD